MDSGGIREWHRRQVEAFAAERPIYQTYAHTLQSLLVRVCRAIAPMAIVQARAKTLPSFAEKAVRKRAKYSDPLHQLTDLCGARVITETQDEVNRVCQFIRAHFLIDEANSDDKRALLGASEFGYLSVHFVVQMPPEIDGVQTPPEIGARKAEIQVRTLLQHAWASIGHDRLYKNEFQAPQSIRRDMNRLAAVLEGTDEAFGQLLEHFDRYAAHYGARLDAARLKQETETLRLLLEQETDHGQRKSLALRLARICRGAGLWTEAAVVLEPFVESGDASVLRDSGHALCRLHRGETSSPSYQSGLARLRGAAEQNPADAECHAVCAWACEPEAPAQARLHAAHAYRLRPSDPYFLSSHIEQEILSDPAALRLSLLGPTLRAGAETCRAHAEAGIELPWAYFVLARFHALLEEGLDALEAATRGIQLCLARDGGTPEDALPAELESLERMRERLPLPALDQLAEAYTIAARTCAKLPPRSSVFPAPVFLIAGSCDGLSGEDAARWRVLLSAAFRGFQGTILSGGTTSGITGIIGELASALAEGACVAGYHPEDETRLDHRYHRLVACGGSGWSAAQPLRMWRDLLFNGVPPSAVTVLGAGGGPLAAFEYSLALALGARVALVDGEGWAIRRILADPVWRASPNLLVLPSDAMTLRAFVAPGRSALDDASVERAARAAHEKYRTGISRKPADPAMNPWEDLPEHLRESNRHQVRYFAEILRAAGYELGPAGLGAAVTSFDSAEVELMAEMEHGRWNVERLRDGWRLGPRDPLRKISPYLVSWHDLPEQVRQWDCDAVNAFPTLAAQAGLEIRRAPRPGTTAGGGCQDVEGVKQ
jgi:ppGpp synthetase/RelA/SpoT-type nucleotidyltranferase